MKRIGSGIQVSNRKKFKYDSKSYDRSSYSSQPPKNEIPQPPVFSVPKADEPELKYQIQSFSPIDFYQQNVGGTYLIFEPPRGSGQSQMIGDFCRVQSIHLRLKITHCPVRMRRGWTPSCHCRVTLLLDKRPSAGPESLDLIPKGTIYGFADPQDEARFQILSDQFLKVGAGYPIPANDLDDHSVAPQRTHPTTQGSFNLQERLQTFEGSFQDNTRALTGKLDVQTAPLSANGTMTGVIEEVALQGTFSTTGGSIGQHEIIPDGSNPLSIQGGNITVDFQDRLRGTSEATQDNRYQSNQWTTWSGDSEMVEIFLTDLDMPWQRASNSRALLNEIQLRFGLEQNSEPFYDDPNQYYNITRVQLWSKVTYTQDQ